MIYNILLIIYILGVLAGLALVFRKAGVAWWKGLIPVYNIVVWIKVCGKNAWWYLYFAVPALNVFTFLLMVTETCKVFRRYGFWEQLLSILVPFAYLPWLGLGKAQYVDPRVEKPAKVSAARDWADAIVFAVVAAVLIRGFFFELYSIPSSSMEGSLLVGDHLVVSKMQYGSRVMMTPLSLPLMHNTIPLTGGKVSSYLRYPQLPYHRFPRFSSVKRYDAVVFNFPAGDTLCTGYPSCQRTYYDLIDELGRDSVWSGRAVDAFGQPVGKVITRPLDKRENYIKRCVGLPGETLEIRNQAVFIDGREVADPAGAQFMYAVQFDPINANPLRTLGELGVSAEELESASAIMYDLRFPLLFVRITRAQAAVIGKRYDVLDIQPVPNGDQYTFLGAEPPAHALFPKGMSEGWTVDNYGPVHIPAKGEVLQLSLDNLPMYRRVIADYEHNTLEVRDGRIFINGQPTDRYTVKQDYYWMMGDNRHNSQDSRFWGFVPEDHVSGKAKRVLWSWDKYNRKLRFDRTFINASRF